MNDALKLISTFVDAVALIMALVLMISILQRIHKVQLANSVLIGCLFSLILVLSMSDPIDLGSAGIFDMRGLLIGAGAALFGPIAGAMTLATGLMMRWGIGGNGMLPGFVGMLTAYGAGLLWLVIVKPRKITTWKKSCILGGMITFQMVAILIAPRELWGTLVVSLLPYTLVTNVLGSLLINHLISGELSFLSEAETSKIEASTDHLTGLVNRRGLVQIYPSLKTSNSSRRGRALLYFDIDRFKAANDTYGHAVGDEVLRQIAERVSDNLRQNDVFARLGGDEFAVVLPQVDITEAQHIADRCRTIVADDPFMIEGKSLDITISLGGIWVKTPAEIDEMLEAADRALYQAKSSGRDAVVFLSREVGGSASRGTGALTPAA